MTHDHPKDLMRINDWRYKIIYKNICMDAELSRHTLRAIFHQNVLLHYIIVIKSWTNVMTEDDVCFEEKNDWSENDELSHHANILSTINSSCMVGRKSATPRICCHFYRSWTLCRCIYLHVNKCVNWRWAIKMVLSLYIIAGLPMYLQSC